jgi:tRNA (guanine37-N1)-methyltransferase
MEAKLKDLMEAKQRSFNVLGNIAVVNFSKEMKSNEKKVFAKRILEQNKSVKTVLEKSGKFKGRLRKMQTKYVAGEKTKEILYKENGCLFRFNIDTTYFSPRLSGERKEIASFVKKNEEVLVMFAGVAPYSIIIAKNSSAKKVYSNEINREANKYAKLNVGLNNLKNKIEIVPGDIKRVSLNLKKTGKKFDMIVMPRPQLKDTFLKQAFELSKKGTRIYYYDFCNQDELEVIKEEIIQEAKESKIRIKIKNIKSAGEIAPYKLRVRFDLVITELL